MLENSKTEMSLFLIYKSISGFNDFQWFSIVSFMIWHLGQRYPWLVNLTFGKIETTIVLHHKNSIGVNQAHAE